MDIVYGVGWDPAGKRLLGPMTAEQAQRLDERGEQYSVLFVSAEGPRLVADVCWRSWYLAVWEFDEDLRRSHKLGYRLLDGRLFHNEVQTWRYEAHHGEFDSRAWHEVVKIGLDGRTYDSINYGEGRGGSGSGSREMDTTQLWRPAPEFGQWRLLTGDGVDAAVPAGLTGSFLDSSESAPSPPWRPPVPLQPGDFEGWFTDGARFKVPHGATCTVRPRTVGRLRLTTGQLIAAESSIFDDDFIPFVVTVPPGQYPVTQAGIIWDKRAGEHVQSAAVRLEIRDEPVASWEMALRPKQDVRLLGESGFYGFGVDAGMGALFDAAAKDVVLTEFTNEQEMALFDHGYLEMSGSTVHDANAIAFDCPVGDGAYPTWIGRTANGDVACFLVDLEMLRDASRLYPTIGPATRTEAP